jgi:hypothetical protein
MAVAAVLQSYLGQERILSINHIFSLPRKVGRNYDKAHSHGLRIRATPACKHDIQLSNQTFSKCNLLLDWQEQTPHFHPSGKTLAATLEQDFPKLPREEMICSPQDPLATPKNCCHEKDDSKSKAPPHSQKMQHENFATTLKEKIFLKQNGKKENPQTLESFPVLPLSTRNEAARCVKRSTSLKHSVRSQLFGRQNLVSSRIEELSIHGPSKLFNANFKISAISLLTLQ